MAVLLRQAIHLLAGTQQQTVTAQTTLRQQHSILQQTQRCLQNGHRIPSITLSVSSLSGFAYAVGTGPSASKLYNLSGANLNPASGNLTVTGSANYEVSTDNSTFSSSVNVPYTGGTLSSTPIYVRLKAGLSIGSYNGETIINSGGGASAQNVTCSGTVLKVSTIYLSSKIHIY